MLIEKKIFFFTKISSRRAEFPVFSLCPSYQRAYKPELLSQDDLNVNDLRNLKYPQNKDSATYHRKVTHNVTEFIRSISFRVRDDIPSTKKGPIIYYFGGKFPSRHKQNFFI